MHPARISETMSSVLRRLDSECNLQAYRVWTFWNEVVGAQIARRAQPSHFANGVLVINVASHSWLQELQFMKDDLRCRLNERLETAVIADMHFVSGGIEAPSVEDSTDEIEELPLPPGRVNLPPIDDPALAQAFERLAVARLRSLARGQKTRLRSRRN